MEATNKKIMRKVLKAQRPQLENLFKNANPDPLVISNAIEGAAQLLYAGSQSQIETAFAINAVRLLIDSEGTDVERANGMLKMFSRRLKKDIAREQRGFGGSPQS